MKSVCSLNMPFVEEAFSTLGETVVKEGRSITAKDARDADILAIRSTTDVSREMLEDSSVKFVGTATIGTDHLDIPYMEETGIKWCFSPGCNSNSVSEYITAALLSLASEHQITLEGLTMGIIGVGNVGSKVARKAEALGMNLLLNDPPREKAEGPGETEFVELDELLHNSDIVTMHVPLVRDGEFPTVQMANDAFFHSMKHGTIFINAARGGIMNTKSLLSVMDESIVSHAIIDTWEDEPEISRKLLDHVDIGTPHIAGHSFDGKVEGTVMVYRAACEALGVEPAWSPENLLPEPPTPVVDIDTADMREEEALFSIVKRIYDIDADDMALRNNPGSFDKLRKEYPMRREFQFTEVKAGGASESLKKKIAGLGFKSAS